MEPHFDVAGLLRARRATILHDASDEVGSRHLPHYEAAGKAELDHRLAALFDVVVDAAARRQLDSALAHAEAIAGERQQTGHDLSEVQRAINALEEQLWHAVLDGAPPDSQGYALGVVSTVLGAIKDRLACAYVSAVAAVPTRTLHIDELFKGTAAGSV